VLDYVGRELRRAQNPALAAGGEVLRRELQHVGLQPEDVESAWDLRYQYRRERLAPRFLSVEDAELIEAEVGAVLHDLRSQLNSGILSDTSIQFHERCRAAIVALRDGLAASTRPPLFMLLGAMYDRVHRGLHRFSRAELEDMLGELPGPPDHGGPPSSSQPGPQQENAA
jgi:hypothetical protein